MDKKPTKNEILESLEKDILILKNTDYFGNYILTKKQFNIFSNCVSNADLKVKEKDQQIAELEKEVKELKEENENWKISNDKTLSGEWIPAICCKKYEEYENKIAVLEKALELACKELMPYRINMCGGLYTTFELQEKIDNFKHQAEKELLGDKE